ncbi:MAG: cation transporter [Dehalococcoidia bacterium]|nr:cation transporter [Dehalococcoidia bacterium]
MQNRLALAFALTAAVLVFEVFGGLLSGSLALLSDAGHVLTDLVALGLSWYGIRQTARPSNYRMTYGYHRVGIFVAFLNAATLIGIALIVVWEAGRRLMEPQPVSGGLMSVVAVTGLAINLLVLVLLRHRGNDLNVRSAFLHVAGDAIASVAVVLSGGLIVVTGWTWPDAATSLIIAAIIVLSSMRIITESVNVLLEGAPGNIDMGDVLRSIGQVHGIREVHHLHLWSITPSIRALSCHVSVDDIAVSEAAMVLSRVNELLEHRFAIRHSTIQLEASGCDPNELYCTLSPEGEVPLAAHGH